MPIIPTIAFLAFAGGAALYGIRKESKNSAICFLLSTIALLLMGLSVSAHERARERAKILNLEYKVQELAARVDALTPKVEQAAGADGDAASQP